MNLRDAKICPVCDEIFEGDKCPRDGEQGAYISQWLKPMVPKPGNPDFVPNMHDTVQDGV